MKKPMIQYHISYAVNVEKFECILVCSGDTDVYTSLLYNYEFIWRKAGLQQIWQQHNEEVSPIHNTGLSHELIRILPAVHALTGSDTTSKISTKQKAFKIAKDEIFLDGLATFGEDKLSGDLMRAAECFLVRCLATADTKTISSFNGLRHFTFHKSQKINLESFPCTSTTIQFHIKRSYLQAYKYKHAAIFETISLDPHDFAYLLEPNGFVPIIVPEKCMPEDFPHPCNCQKCSRANVCACRMTNIPCCDFCKCRWECKYSKDKENQ